MNVIISDDQRDMIASILTDELRRIKSLVQEGDMPFDEEEIRDEIIELANMFGANIDWDSLDPDVIEYF